MLRHHLISGLANVVLIDVRGLLSPSLRSPPDLGLLSSHNGPQDINMSHKIIWIFSDAFGIVSTGRIFPKRGRSLYFEENTLLSLCPAVFFSFIQRSYSAGPCASPSGNLVDRQVDSKPDAEKTGESSSEAGGAARFRPSAHVPAVWRKVPPETAPARLTPDRLLPLPLATCCPQVRTWCLASLLWLRCRSSSDTRIAVAGASGHRATHRTRQRVVPMRVCWKL